MESGNYLFFEPTKLIGVSGESRTNPDGSNRQEIISRCTAGEPIQLIPDPTNPYDEFAVKVCRANGEQIGFVPKDKAMELSPELQAGTRFEAIIETIHPPEGKRPFSAVVLQVTQIDFCRVTEFETIGDDENGGTQ